MFSWIPRGRNVINVFPFPVLVLTCAGFDLVAVSLRKWCFCVLALGFMQSRDVQGLLPLTVKQISQAFEASDDKTNFLIDGVDVNNVSSLLIYNGFVVIF